MRTLLLLPPMTQVNAPYPATAFLTGFLRSRGLECAQADLAIGLVLRLFSQSGLRRALKRIPPEMTTPAIDHLRANAEPVLAAIDPVIRFLQGRDPTLALRIASRNFLPEGPRFAPIEDAGPGDGDALQWAFGSLGTQDLAKYLATLFLADLADAVRDGIDPRFELARYAEKLALSAPSFDSLRGDLQKPPTLVDELLAELTRETLATHRPDFVGITAPFPGNVYGAFRMAQTIRADYPDIRIAFGGGYANTELRELADTRIFDYFDYVCLDDGESVFLKLLEVAAGKCGPEHLARTFVREGDRVVLRDAPAPPLPHAATGTPTYDGLPVGDYLQVFDMLNPMHRIWSDGRWNKLMVAHGCYWSKCSFCDTSLPYIQRYSTAPADLLVDRMEALIRETGQTGFHFVDEAAPPAMLKKLADRLLARGVTATWWGNIRFDTYFTPEVCDLLARSGCVAVTGGLEVAEDRLLELMQKGVSVAQVARVTRNFAEAGVMTHAYLMYGYPTQTVQETVNALEFVRQLFEAGCLQSAYWHRFALTVHSPVFQALEKHHLTISNDWNKATFARNEVPFTDATGIDHDRLGVALRKALYNYMHGAGLDVEVHRWFGRRTPQTTVPPDYIRLALDTD